MTTLLDGRAFDRSAKRPPVAVQALPCWVDFNGPAPVSSFLVAADTKSSVRIPQPVPPAGAEHDARTPPEIVPVQQSAMRGRGLLGVRLHAPAGYAFAAVERTRPPHSVEADTYWRVCGASDDCLVWLHDETPSVHTEPMLQLPAWTQLQAAVHAPVSAAECEGH
ncbi:Ribonuclease H2 subunit C [Polyrhizophydium stewartii]|uniref:Ribonuclease H2 subunit C n=1 Tax=Polyrhizophydium stewartii TaxID=2732419 RepID=A0ABR4NCK2_9FUNG